MSRRKIRYDELTNREREKAKELKAQKDLALSLDWGFDETTVSIKSIALKSRRWKYEHISMMVMVKLDEHKGYYRVVEKSINKQTLKEKISFVKAVKQKEGITKFMIDKRPVTIRLKKIGGIPLGKRYTSQTDRRLSFKLRIYNILKQIKPKTIGEILTIYRSVMIPLGWIEI